MNHTTHLSRYTARRGTAGGLPSSRLFCQSAPTSALPQGRLEGYQARVATSTYLCSRYRSPGVAFSLNLRPGILPSLESLLRTM